MILGTFLSSMTLANLKMLLARARKAHSGRWYAENAELAFEMHKHLPTLLACAEALRVIVEDTEQHPMYMGDEATEEQMVSEGGDAASITYWNHTARVALKALEKA